MFNTIQKDRKESLGKDKVKYNLLGVIVAEIQRTKTKNIEDADVLKVLIKIQDSIKLTIENLSSGSIEHEETEKLAQYIRENEIVESYLPKQLSDEELFNIIKEAITNDASMKEKKNIFPFLKSKYNGSYKGEQANKAYNQVLESL